MKKNSKGEGSTYYTIQKQKRKNRLDKMCKICSACNDRSICNNREGTKKCDKCKKCTDCLKYCDRFYCNEIWVAQATVNGKQTTISSGKNKKEVNKTKRIKLVEIDRGNYVDKTKVSLLECMYELEDSKLKANLITESSYIRNNEAITNIAKNEIVNLPIQKITKRNLEDILNSKVNYSQSVIDKVYDELNATFRKAVEDKIIEEYHNPMRNLQRPLSNKDKKEVQAFDREETKKIIEHISSSQFTLGSISEIDEITAKNILLLALAIGARCGEICALDCEESIDFESREIIISKTLSRKIKEQKEVNGIRKLLVKIDKGDTTKTGRVLKKLKKSAIRHVSFDISKDIDVDLDKILKQQVEVAKNNKYNKLNLLFCRKDGSCIATNQVTNLLKRICRELNIKPELPTGCAIHMTRHTFVTRCIEQDINIHTIAYWVGDTVATLEKTYVHILKRFQDKELQKKVV